MGISGGKGGRRVICKSSWQKMSNLVLQFRGKNSWQKMRQVKISCGRNVKCQNEWGDGHGVEESAELL